MAKYPSSLINLSRVIAVILAATVATAANASLTITSVIGGAPVAVNYANFDNLALGTSGGTSGGLNVSFTGSASEVKGSSGTYAAPFLSNSNGILFGDSTVSGPDATPYVATGGSGSVTLVLPGSELYFGLLWGSVDPGSSNTLTFLSPTGTSVGSITGPDVTTTASGNQGASGTYYVNITSTLPFLQVVASGGVFEFDNVSYNPTIPVPEPSTGLLLSGFVGVSLFLRKRGNSIA